MGSNVDVVERWLRVLAAGDLDAWPAIVAEDVVVEFPFLRGAAKFLQGLDKARTTIGEFWNIFEVFEWSNPTILETGDPDLMLVTANSSARTVSGREYTNSYVLLVRVRNRKILRHTEYFDPIAATELMQGASA